MARSKVVRAGGKRYRVRGLTFEELIMLGSMSAKRLESKQVVTEVLSECLITPKLTRNQIVSLSDSVLARLAVYVLELASVSARMASYPYPRTESPRRGWIA